VDWQDGLRLQTGKFTANIHLPDISAKGEVSGRCEFVEVEPDYERDVSTLEREINLCPARKHCPAARLLLRFRESPSHPRLPRGRQSHERVMEGNCLNESHAPVIFRQVAAGPAHYHSSCWRIAT
jgi:hypothetical protein